MRANLGLLHPVCCVSVQGTMVVVSTPTHHSAGTKQNAQRGVSCVCEGQGDFSSFRKPLCHVRRGQGGAGAENVLCPCAHGQGTECSRTLPTTPALISLSNLRRCVLLCVQGLAVCSNRRSAPLLLQQTRSNRSQRSHTGFVGKAISLWVVSIYG